MSRATTAGETQNGQEDSEEYGHSLLIEEPPLQVLPSLATAIGLECAIVVQQLHYFLRDKKNGKTVNGHRWIFNTYEQWMEFFPFWSQSTLERIFRQLEEMMIVISCQPEGVFSRRKYYRINLGVMNLIRKGKLKKPRKRSKWDKLPSSQVEVMDKSNWSLPVTETTIKENLPKEPKGTGSVEPAVLIPSEDCNPHWKPDERTPEEQLRFIKRPKDYPSEIEFKDYVENSGFINLDDRANTDGLYGKLCDNKWRKWTGRRWAKIRDWKAYVRGLERHIDKFVGNGGEF